MEDEKVLCYKDTVLRNSDIGILQGQCELTDDIIGFYFQYIASEFECDDIALVPPSVSFLLTNTESPDEAKETIEPMKLSDKKVVIFPVNNCVESDDPENADDGTHWSTLVYYSSMHMFVHLDTMRNVNNECATRLYEVVKGFFLSKPSSKGGSKSKKKKDRQFVKKTDDVVPAIPGFIEYEMTPQQSNGYDCGLYVLAIAKTICQWHVGRSRGKDSDWFAAMKNHVNASNVEMSMRSEVLMAVKELQISS